MTLSEKQIVETVSKMKLEEKYKKLLIKQCLEGNPNVRFTVYANYKKQNQV